jgi:hypothetical protein
VAGRITVEEHLRGLGAPEEFCVFAKDKTAREVWDSCTRPDWLLWWAAGTGANEVTLIKLATHDCASIISRPHLEPRPAWARTIGDTWGCDPRMPERMQAWAEWAAWSAALADRSTEKRLCDSMRSYRLHIPWEESGCEGMEPEAPQAAK